MKKLRLFIMLVLIVAAVGTSTSTYATGMGWGQTDYYDDAQWTNWVGGRRVDGCNPSNNYNVGSTSDYKEVSGDSCDGGQYACNACIYYAGHWYCDYICAHDH